MIAGPSEILVIADDTADPQKFAAADLMSQAEHDVLASAIMVTTSEKTRGRYTCRDRASEAVSLAQG